VSRPCLANLDAFWNADAVDLAEAVLQVLRHGRAALESGDVRATLA
jgi:hypothetical protein